MKKLTGLLLLCASCAYLDLDPAESDYVVFGTFAGFCQGERCIEIYKLTSRKLYEDRRDKYPLPDKPYDGDFQLLSKDYFEKVKAFPSDVPAQLLNTPNGVIGQPDAGDWGGYYFEISKNGKKQFWLIDTMQANLPEYLRPFATEIQNYIALID